MGQEVKDKHSFLLCGKAGVFFFWEIMPNIALNTEKKAIN